MEVYDFYYYYCFMTITLNLLAWFGPTQRKIS